MAPTTKPMMQAWRRALLAQKPPAGEAWAAGGGGGLGQDAGGGGGLGGLG